MNCWHVIGASVQGISHIANNIPCQDSYQYKKLDNNSVLIAVSDGAGSKMNSHIGSKFITEEVIALFSKRIKKRKWYISHPDDKTWRTEAIKLLKVIALKRLKKFSEKNNYDYNSLGATIIVAFITKNSAFCINIGDGRGAICNTDNKWTSIVKPLHGEQAGMTVFLTTDYIWENEKVYIHTQKIEEPIKAFTFLTDGCENTCFECYIKNKDGTYYDPNKPFEDFLNPNIEMLYKLLDQDSIEDINKKWSSFLKSGNEVLKNETDDKTMLLGICKSEKSQ